MSKMAIAILSVVVTAVVCGVAYPAAISILERRAAAKVADRNIPSDAQLIGRSQYAVPLTGNGYSTWVFSLSSEAWQREFTQCPEVRKLRPRDLDSYRLHGLFRADESVCFHIAEETGNATRAWFAS